jgi:trigger factor
MSKSEFIDVTETQKNLVVEIPSSVVDAEIDRVTRDYSRAARIPGFRPGKVPPKLVRQRFREQILHEVAHDLIPRAVDEALRERGVEPVDTPDIRDVVVEEGRPLTFTASFETVPPIDPGDYTALTVRKPPVAIEESAVDQMVERIRERAARLEPVEDRGAEAGDTLIVDLARRRLTGPPGAEAPDVGQAEDRHEDVSVELGAEANPPGFTDELSGLRAGEHKVFTISYPVDHALQDLAGAQMEYAVTVKAVRRRVLPDLDDEFARDAGEFESLEALRERLRQDLTRQAHADGERQARADMLKQLASRIPFEIPSALVNREIDRRTEEFVRRLLEQQVDPMRTTIDWEAFRERQREPAAEAVRAALVLDEVARREQLVVTEQELAREIEQYAERTGRTASAVRAGLEKEGGLGRLAAGLRREKAIDFVLSRARILEV